MQIFLETDRLVLRRFTESDVDNLVDLDGDPEVMRFVNGGKPRSRDVIRNETLPRFLHAYERFEGFGVWAAIERWTREFVGWFEFYPREDTGPDEVELGYRLRRSAWGKGYAAEGSRALIRKGFTELGVRRVVAETMAVNAASRRAEVHADVPPRMAGAHRGRRAWGRRVRSDEGRLGAAGSCGKRAAS